MDVEFLVKLTSRAWALPILAALQSGTPGRQAPLVTATGAGRTAFAHSIDHLIDLGLVERNPGHGHPLRPEFRLTAAGKGHAATAARVKEALNGPADWDLLRRAWTLPVLAVTGTPQHFSDIRAALPSITDRALSQALQLLHKRRWLRRRIAPSVRPPRPLYCAANTGALVRDALVSGAADPAGT